MAPIGKYDEIGIGVTQSVNRGTPSFIRGIGELASIGSLRQEQRRISYYLRLSDYVSLILQGFSASDG
jgi:hypothetical protein